LSVPGNIVYNNSNNMCMCMCTLNSICFRNANTLESYYEYVVFSIFMKSVF